MFVPVDLLKPILGELKARGSSRSSQRAWLGLNCVELDGQVRVIRLSRRQPGRSRGPAAAATSSSPSTATRVADLASLYRTLWRGDRAERDVVLEIRRDGEAHAPARCMRSTG